MSDIRRPLALVVNTGDDAYQRQLVQGAVSVLAPRGLVLVLNSLTYSERGLPAPVEQVIRTCAPYGLLATACRSEQEEADLVALIADLRLPAVRIGVHSPGLSSVRGESVTGMRALMGHLLDDRGIRRPAFVRGVRHQPDAIQREQVFREELAVRGLPVDEELLVDGSFWYATAYTEVRALLGRRRDMDAVVAANDLSAQGALKALTDAGLRVPDDLLVTGFDRDPSTLTWPALTTVDPDLRAQGVAAAIQLLAEVDGAGPVADLVVASRLLIRGSTGTPDAGTDRPDAAEAARTAQEQLLARDALWALDAELSRCTGLDEIAATLAAGHLPRLGINRCFMAVYTEPPAGEPGRPLHARLVLDYRGGTAEPVPDAEFPLGRLLPESLQSELASDVLVLLPLDAADRHVGYLLVEQGAGWSQVCEGLRMHLSRTLAVLSTTRALKEQHAAVLQLRREADERSQAQAQAQLRLASIAFEQAADGIVVIDAAGLVLSMNPAFSTITGYQPQELIGQPLDKVSPPNGNGNPYSALAAGFGQSGRWVGELQGQRRDGEVFTAAVSISAVEVAPGRPGQFVITCNDVTELRRKDEHIRRLAFHDELTGLPNRALLIDRLNQALALADRQGEATGVMLVDLDRFKVVNDSYGHDVGNELLKEIAGRLKDFVRQSDTVARIGPDQFVIVCTQDNGPEDLAVIARRLIAQLSLPMTVGGHVLRVGASIGMASFPDDGRDAAALMTQSEAAMRSAKTAGGGGHRFFRPEMTAHTQRKFELEMELRDAVANGELVLHYQPKVALLDGSLRGAEALVRWNHPTRGLLPPMEFIPLAEERGLILELGAWVLDEACRQAGEWQRTDGRAGGEDVDQLLRPAGAPHRRGEGRAVRLRPARRLPSGVEIELTETGIMDNLAEISPAFSGLRDTGVTVAVDDFGIGHSGFAYLRDLPVDVLKIDRSFIMNLETKQQDREILHTIVTLGRALRLDVVAEGVETRYQADLLLSMQCHTAQGYLFARPMPAAQFRDNYLLPS